MHVNPRWLVSEALWSIRSRPARSVVLVLTTLGLFCGVLVADVSAGQHAVDDYTQQLQSGGNVIVVTNSANSVSAHECESANLRSDVVAAGGVLRADSTHFDSAPGIGLQTARITPGFMGAIASIMIPSRSPVDNAEQVSLILGKAASSETGLLPGASSVSDTFGPARVSTVVNVETRAPEKARWVFAVDNQLQYVEECHVEAAEGRRDAVRSSIAASFPTETMLSISALSQDPPETALDEWNTDPMRHLWLAGAILLLAISAIIALNRRNEYALWSVIGLRKTETAIIATTEFALITFSGFSMTALAAALLAWQAHIDATVLAIGLQSILMMLTAALVAFPILLIPLLRGDIAVLVRDRG